MPSSFNGRRVYGSYRDDLLFGSSGNDTFYGSYGTDTLVGGSGNDFYYVNNSADSVVEHAGGGNDTVYSSVNYVLGDQIEGLILSGSSQIDGTGNALDNDIVGNRSANRLNGGAGNDTIEGGGGNDSIDGGSGIDTAVFSRNYSDYVITTTAAGTTVRALSTSEGTNTLVNVEQLQFKDRTVDLTAPANRAPVAQGDSVTVQEDGSVTFQPKTNDSDPDGNALTITSILTAPAHGTVTLNADNTLTYRPATNYNGADSLVYQISDGKGGTASATVSIGVSPVNDAPVAAADSVTTSEDGSVTFQPKSNDSDVDGDTLTISAIVSSPAHGTATLNVDNTITYRPSADYNGSDSLTYQLSDGKGGTSTATVSIGVTPANDAPVALGNYHAVLSEDTPATFSAAQILANVVDPDGDQLTIASVLQAPAHASVTVNADGSLTLVPAADFNGSDSLVLLVSDGHGGTVSKPVSIEINAVNDAPVAKTDSASAQAGQALTINVLANDTDVDGDTLQLAGIAANPAHGTVTVNANGTLTYTAAANYTGNDTLSYTVSDGTVSRTGVVNLTVAGAPASVPLVSHGSASYSATGDVYTLTNGYGQAGMVTSGARIDLQQSFTIAFDAYLGASDSGADGMAFVLHNDSAGTGAIGSDGSGLGVGGIRNGLAIELDTFYSSGAYVISGYDLTSDHTCFVDTDGSFASTPVDLGNIEDGQWHRMNVVWNAATRTLSYTLDGQQVGTLTSDLATAFFGGSQYAYFGVAASTGGLYNNQQVRFTNLGVVYEGGGQTETGGSGSTEPPTSTQNHAPVANADSVTTAEDTSVTFQPKSNDTDSDGNTLTISSIVTGPTHGTVTLNANNTLTYTPAADYNGSDSLVYRISDGNGGTAQATVNLSVTAVNDVPVAGADSASTTAGTPVTFWPLTNDTDRDGDSLSVSGLASTPSHGTATVNAGGSITYTPAAGYTGSDSLVYRISDGHGGTAQGTVVLSVGAAPSSGGGSGSGGGTDWIDGNSVVPMADPSQAGDVVGVRFQNLSSVSGSGQVVTFGEVFLQGEVAAGSHLMARIGGQLVPVQMDVKTSYADGSVKQAVLSVAPTALTGGGTTEMMLTTSGSGATGAALTASQVLSHGYDLKVLVDLHDGQGVRTIDAASVLSQAIQTGKVETWLSGPLASEFRVTTTVAGDLKAKFDIRLTADGGIATDVILAREATYVNSSTYMQNITYDATIKSNGTVVSQYNNLTHIHNATWHDEVWSGQRADVHVVHDVDHLVATGAVPGYDTSAGINQSTLSSLTTGDTAPMGNGTVTEYMPMTGGRSDIGVLTGWSAQYLLSQDSRAAATMFSNADASGSIPWHFVDEATNDAVRLDQHPGLWIDYRQSPGSSADALPVTYTSDNTSWVIDGGHEPSLTYLPYLLTGSHYYLDEIQAQASYNIASTWGWYRDPSSPTFAAQLRSGAWQLRTLSQAATSAPDGDPMKGYFTAQTNQLLSHLIDINITKGLLNGSGQWEGWFRADYPEGVVAPWQNDYMVMTLAQLATQGFSQAVTLLEWTENFTAGRFLNGDNGYDPLAGPTYYLSFGPGGGQYYSTWAELYQANFAGNTSTEFGYGAAYPNTAGGYAAEARGALASLFNTTHSVDSLEAFGYVVSQTQNGGMPASFKDDPTFFMTPELPDGSMLAIGDMTVASGTGATTLTGNANPNLLYGNAGNDVIDGAAGSDVLFGSKGNDTIKGGTGNDYLYGGKGNDRLEGGADADIFVFDRVNAGQDVIADFNRAEDHIAFGSANVANQGLTAAALLAGATVDGSGNLVLHPGSGSDITLLGIHQGDLSASHFLIG